MSFSSKLYYILADIQKYKHCRSDSLELHIKKRLEDTLTQYEKQTNQSVEYLTNRDSINVLKKLNRGG